MKHQRKKNTNATFDTSTGSCDGTEHYQFIEIYIQYFLINILSKDDMGLKRDNGLFILHKINKWSNKQVDKLRKKIISIFKNINLNIEIVTNLISARLSRNSSNADIFNNSKITI